LPSAARSEGFRSWRVTLAEALLVGVQETMQAGRRDLNWFERLEAEEPQALVIYDTMPGGTGYLPKLLADGAAGLKAAAQLAIDRLETCSCTGSCHRCLRDFWNQRQHHLLDRYEILGQLRRLADSSPVDFDATEDDRFDSFLEMEFFDRLAAAGMPAPTLQVTRELQGRRVTVVDATWSTPNISVFLDGRAYHAVSVDKIIDDLDKRNRLEARGDLVLEFTYRDVLTDFDDTVLPALRRALAGDMVDSGLDPATLSGLEVLNHRPAPGTSSVRVNPDAWLADEQARQRSLTAANRLRLAGWRLRRVTA
jgi:hypothetical protein